MATDVEWRYTDEAERVRVSTRTGRIIPLPSGYYEHDDLVNPTFYLGKSMRRSFIKSQINLLLLFFIEVKYV